MKKKAWTEGYETAWHPNDGVCPYPEGPLARAWWDGYGQGTDDYINTKDL